MLTREHSAMKLGLSVNVRPFSVASHHDDLTLRRLGCRPRSRNCEYPETAQDSQPKKRPRRAKLDRPQDREDLRPGVAHGASTPQSALVRSDTILSESTSLASPGSAAATPTSYSRSPVSRSSLSPKQRFYFGYLQESIRRDHYLLNDDATELIHAILVNAALTFEPLFYAVISFAAFYHAVRYAGNNRLEFLDFYCQSVSLLRKSLRSGEPRTDATILTILQLATLEVGRAYPYYRLSERDR